MANKLRGEVPLQVGDAVYTLRFSANAICELEDFLDMGMQKIAKQLSDPENLRMKTVVAVLWAGLRDHHPDITMAQAGEIITDATMPVAMEAVTDAFVLTFAERKTEAVPTKPGPKSPAKNSSAGTGSLS